MRPTTKDVNPSRHGSATKETNMVTITYRNKPKIKSHLDSWRAYRKHQKRLVRLEQEMAILDRVIVSSTPREGMVPAFVWNDGLPSLWSWGHTSWKQNRRRQYRTIAV